MFTAITVNVVHVLCSLWFAFGLDMGIVGIAYASVIAQWTGVALSALLLFACYRRILTGIDWAEVVNLKPLRTFFIVNRDIMLRTFCIVAVYTFFTGASARMDEPALLAVNTLLLQLFTLFSYMNDGFAYAAEALTGRFIGARDEGALRDCLRRCIAWGTVVSVPVGNALIATTHGSLYTFLILLTCFRRFGRPFSRASRFSLFRSAFGTPPLYFSARTVATITTALG